MAFLTRVGQLTSITTFLLLTILVTWIRNGESIGNLEAHINDRLVEIVNPDDVFFEIVDPPELRYTYKIKPAKDFGMPFNASFLEQEIPLVPVDPPTGCRTPDNAEQLKGKVALVWRGNCTFFRKTMIAEEAGAKAIIVADYHANSIEDERETPLWMDNLYIEMVSDDDSETTKNLNIPAGIILGKNGRIIKETLKRLDMQFALINIPVNLTLARLSKYDPPPWISI